jgi:8-oxo-dGTP pyrophosphatase MutT (NUDIX family)
MGAPRPWKRLSKGEEQDLTILRIREDTFSDPRDGSPHPRVVITAPDWVNVIALTREGQALLVRQFRFGVETDTLEIPGGMVDKGEEPAGAAARELEEETGFCASELVFLGAVHPNPALQSNRCHSYLALGCEKKSHPRAQDAGEDIEVVLVPASALQRLVRDGTITHALVVNAIYFAELAGAL